MNLLRDLAIAIFLLSPLSANAATSTGESAFGGSAVGADWTAATQIDFVSLLVTLGTNDFGGVPVGALVTVQDPFVFDPAGSGTIDPFWTFNSGGLTYSFALVDWTITQRAPDFLDLSGSGTVRITGFEDTAATWTLSIDQAGTGFAGVSMTIAATSGPEPPDPTVTVQIDIKPGSESNCFNANGHGVIPVAVLGSETFDVSSIDQTSLSFGGDTVRVRGNKGPFCGVEDTNADGFNDIVCQFEDNAEYWEPGQSDATLTGSLLDGTSIEGTDTICIVP